MKKSFLPILAAFVIALVLYQSTWGQEVASVAEVQLDSAAELMGSLDRIANALETFIEKKAAQPSDTALTSDRQAASLSYVSSLGETAITKSCFYKIYNSGPTPGAWSAIHKEGPWDLITAVPMINDFTNNPKQQEGFTDLNGDGLIDYYFYKRSGIIGTVQSLNACVFLGNGNGFDLVHYCDFFANSTGDTRYWGSCADYSAS